MAKGSLVCRRITMKKAARIVAKDKGISKKSARLEVTKATEGWDDQVELTPPGKVGVRYIDTKHGSANLSVCTDTRIESLDNDDERVFTSRPALIIIGLLIGIAIGAGAKKQ